MIFSAAKRVRALLLAGALTSSMASAQEKPVPEKGSKVEDKAGQSRGAKTAEEEEEGGGLQAAKFMPLGRANLKVKIPQFEDGELQCVMNAEEMTRIDDELIDIKSMDMEFLENGEAVTRIELLDARYNLTDKLIKSDKRAVVQRSDFTLVGSSLEFDTDGQRGKMQGKVRMVIHDASSFAAEEEEEDEKEASDQPAAEGLNVLEAARMIARVADYQRRQLERPETNP